MDDRGVLFLVVGPSGAGKDTLLDGAAARLADDPRFRFPARVITRPAEAGGEDHQPVSGDAFTAMREGGKLALWWQAHGLRYGIRADTLAPLAEGVSVVVNVSRTVIDEARVRFRPVRVLLVDAPDRILARRLHARGRESAPDIAERLRRARATEPAGPDVVRVVNDADPETGIQRFVAALLAAHQGTEEG